MKIVTEQKEKRIHTVEMTSEELAAIFMISGRVTGDPERTIRKITDQIWESLTTIFPDPPSSSPLFNQHLAAVDGSLTNTNFTSLVDQFENW